MAAHSGLDQYERAFRDNDVDAEVLAGLTADDLRELGVASLGHRKKLLSAIAALSPRFGAEAEAVAAAMPPETAPADASASKTLRAERRHLTVMFVDLAGSTALSARLDPEDMREIISAYHDAVAAGVKRFEGYVAKLMGDGVLAYFGWPRAHEDEAERAVRAGLAIVQAVGALDIRGDHALTARVGIATGLVVVGDLVGEGAAQEEAVVGETPNVAARLQQLAPPGAVVIAESTRRLLGGLFSLVELGPQPVRGIETPIPVFHVLREAAAESRFEALRTVELGPLIGRDLELALLLDRWETAKVGEGQVVLLSGEAGIGKSRLVLALRERLRGEACSRIGFSCSPHHVNSALWPIVTQLERAAGYSRDDTWSAKLEHLEALLGQAGEPLASAVPPVAELLGLPLEGRYPVPGGTPQEKKARVFAVLLAQLEGLAHRQPVLVVLEDAQWLDPTTSEFFDRFADRLRQLPVLFVATLRPEWIAPWARYLHATTLSLNRLGRSGSRMLIERTTGDRALPPAISEAILSRTEGVPLFVEELTKTVLESGLFAGASGDGSFELRNALPPLAIPETLQDSLLARPERLAPTREVAQIAACIGREFDEEIVGAVADLSQPLLADALDQLRQAQLIQRHGTPPRHVYAFKHALVRDAAYATLLRSRRRQLHLRIAEAIERLRPETVAGQPEILAQHFMECGLRDRAAAYLLAAGRLAKGRNAIREAVSQLEACLKLMSQPAEETEPSVRETKRECLLMLGDLAGVVDDLDRANNYYECAAALADADADRRNAQNRMHRIDYAERDGARIAFYEHGTGEQAIVFINPIHYGLSVFQPIVEQLCQEFRIITVDCRGAGRSDPLVRPYGTLNHMEDLAAIIETAAAAPVIAVGISAASALVLQLAANHPQSVCKLMVVGADWRGPLPDGFQVRDPEFARRRDEIIGRGALHESPGALEDPGALEELIELVAESCYSRPEEAELRRLSAERWRRLPRQTTLSFFGDPDPGRDIAPLLGSLAVPVLVAHGREDRQKPWTLSEFIASRIPGAQLYLFDGAGHLPMFSATDEFCRVLRNFIRTGRAESPALEAAQ